VNPKEEAPACGAFAEPSDGLEPSTPRPSTIHSFAISVLVANPDAAEIPQPLRIADNWEERHIVYPTLARRAGVTVTAVRRLIAEMAANWESLRTDEDPRVSAADRARFLGAWNEHRRIYGYTLLAELPYELRKALRDHPDLDGVEYDLLIVDEYQDLNACDLEVIKLIGERGCSVIGAGDDDQSIYSGRKAAPEGIRNFLGDYPCADDYTLSITALALGIPCSDPDRVDRMLSEVANRRALAIFRLAANREDSLGWSTLLLLADGIGSSFTDSIYERAREEGTQFGHALLAERVAEFPRGPAASARRAETLINQVIEWLEANPPPQEDDTAWGRWMIESAGSGPVPALSDDLRELLLALNELVEADQPLERYLGQIRPLGRDLDANESAGVRIMSMASAKGLTVRATIVAALEEGVIPRPGYDEQEERRLLYVAMTRSKRGGATRLDPRDAQGLARPCCERIAPV
jgi:superfamily I DNA/RNA helicase